VWYWLKHTLFSDCLGCLCLHRKTPSSCCYILVMRRTRMSDVFGKIYTSPSKAFLPNPKVRKSAVTTAASAEAAAVVAAATAAPPAPLLSPPPGYMSRARFVTAFGGSYDGVADLVARAIRSADDEESVLRLPPTDAFPGGSRLGDEDAAKENPSRLLEEDRNNTLLLAALPSVLVLDTASGKTSLDAAIRERCSSSEAMERKATFDDVTLVWTTASDTFLPPATIPRHILLDVIFRWRKGGGRPADAPAALEAVAFLSLFTAAERAAELVIDSDRSDPFRCACLVLQPQFRLTARHAAWLKNQFVFDTGDAPMDAVLLRACCLYTYTFHYVATSFTGNWGRDSWPRTITAVLEDEFMHRLLRPRADTGQEWWTKDTLFAAELRDAQPWRKPVHDHALELASHLRMGRRTTANNIIAHKPLPFQPRANFYMCLQMADASLRVRPYVVPVAHETPRWIRGRPCTLTEAVTLLARTPNQWLRLRDFWRRRRRGDCVVLAFEEHASLGLYTFKRACRIMSCMLQSYVPDFTEPWYTCMRYTRRNDPLPGYLLVAERTVLTACNLLYRVMQRPDDVAAADVANFACANCSAQSAIGRHLLMGSFNPLDQNSIRQRAETLYGDGASRSSYDDAVYVPVIDHGAWQTEEEEDGKRAEWSYYGEDAFREFCADWPTARDTDPLEYYHPSVHSAVKESAKLARGYMCATDASIATRLAAEASSSIA
jgi:hypothetical protein